MLASEMIVGDSYVDSAGNLVTKRANGTLSVKAPLPSGKCRVEKSHAAGTDISTILNAYVRSNVPIQMPPTVFNDFTQIPDYQSCLNAVNSIDDYFSALPSKVRAAFDHRPSLLMDALNDPSKRDMLIELGVLEPSTAVQADVSETISDSEKNSTAEGGLTP